MRNVPLSPLTLVLVALLCGQAAGAAEAGDPKVVDTDVGGVEAPEIPVDEVAPKVAKDAGDLVVAGYLRALAGINSEGSRAACFQLAGAGAKYRLGHECAVYGELFFGKQIVSFTAVSYTHLDVYKRQTLACALRDTRLRVALVEHRSPSPSTGWDARVYAVSPVNARFLQEIGAWKHLAAERI